MEKEYREWRGCEEFYTKDSWICWIRTGRHICSYIVNKGANQCRCIICGKKKIELESKPRKLNKNKK
jgi:hypothetical protein